MRALLAAVLPRQLSRCRLTMLRNSDLKFSFAIRALLAAVLSPSIEQVPLGDIEKLGLEVFHCPARVAHHRAVPVN
jgi:hypothetical protein